LELHTACSPAGDEMFPIRSGKFRLMDHTIGGSSYHLGPSDSLFVLDGSRVTWDSMEDVVKVFLRTKSWTRVEDFVWIEKKELKMMYLSLLRII
jgi:hypothetical protein